jgi:hypothetical protein
LNGHKAFERGDEVGLLKSEKKVYLSISNRTPRFHGDVNLIIIKLKVSFFIASVVTFS